MTRNSKDGKYDKGERKHDCPKPFTGCTYPECGCDVDRNELSAEEKKQIEDTQEVVERVRGLVDDE